MEIAFFIFKINLVYSPKILDLGVEFRYNVSDLMYRLNISNELNQELAGETFILAGMNYNPISLSKTQMEIYRNNSVETIFKDLVLRFVQRKQETLMKIENLPSHYEFLRNKIYKD